MKRPTLEQAQRKFVHRFTMEYVPAWACRERDDGSYYAPQFRSDAEWYANTTFPGEAGHLGDSNHCYTSGQTWPLGTSLVRPYSPEGK